MGTVQVLLMLCCLRLCNHLKCASVIVVNYFSKMWSCSRLHSVHALESSKVDPADMSDMVPANP